MRRRKPQLSTSPGAVPAELLIGHVLDVWSDEDGRAITMSRMHSARQNYRRARTAWEELVGLDRKETHKLLPSSQPLDVDYLCQTGRQADAEARLARAGVTIDDLPALRERAQAWLEESA